MAFGKKSHEYLLDNLVLPDDGFAKFVDYV
jgi:hypothetical protein